MIKNLSEFFEKPILTKSINCLLSFKEFQNYTGHMKYYKI